ncbi:hypothetical protein Tco_1171021, partial [Tanacetum coccineum]
QESPTVVHEDNATCIAQLKDEYIKGDKTKHILPKFFFTHDLQKSGDIIVQKVRSSDNQADLFTKALPTTTFKKLVHGTGMRRLNELNTITDIKCVLSQRAFDVFCEKFHILEEVHSILPNQGNTIHERPIGKIGLYTRFFDFANFRLPLSTFPVDILSLLFSLLIVLCFEDMDIFAFIRTTDPTKGKVVERERREDEPCGTQVEQRDSTGGGDGQDTVIQPITTITNIVAEDVILLQPRRQRKRKTIISDAGGPSHPPKRLREDHVTPSEASICGKSGSAVQRLLVGAVQNYKVRGELLPTFPFVTSSVSATPEREDEDSSHHSGASIAKVEVDSFTRPSVLIITAATTVTSTVDPAVVVKEKVVKPSLVAADSSSASGADPNAGIFLDLTRSDFLVSGVRTIIDPDTDLQKMVDEFAPPKFFTSVWGMEHDQLFTEFNVEAARQMSLSSEVRMHAEEAKAAEALRLRA